MTLFRATADTAAFPHRLVDFASAVAGSGAASPCGAAAVGFSGPVDVAYRVAVADAGVFGVASPAAHAHGVTVPGVHAPGVSESRSGAQRAALAGVLAHGVAVSWPQPYGPAAARTAPRCRPVARSADDQVPLLGA